MNVKEFGIKFESLEHKPKTEKKNLVEIKCVGCENIKNQSFPFCFDGKRRCFIDTEGCGITQKGDSFLQIFYCPVCGKKLNEKLTKSKTKRI